MWAKIIFLISTSCVTLSVSAATPQELLKSYEDQSGKAVAARGEQFFNTKHGKEWSCSSCHENPPNHETKHAITSKIIKPLAPSANSDRFTAQSKVESGSRETVTTCWVESVPTKRKPTSCPGC